MILKIETQNDSLYWKSLFKQWCDTYHEYLNTRSYKPETEICLLTRDKSFALLYWQ